MLTIAYIAYILHIVARNAIITIDWEEDMEKIAMNVKEMAKHLGVSAYTAYQLTKRPGFPTLKIGKRIAIPVEQFMEWIARHAGND